jgi:Glutathione S-transferase, N-terminal domain
VVVVPEDDHALLVAGKMNVLEVGGLEVDGLEVGGLEVGGLEVRGTPTGPLLRLVDFGGLEVRGTPTGPFPDVGSPHSWATPTGPSRTFPVACRRIDPDIYSTCGPEEYSDWGRSLVSESHSPKEHDMIRLYGNPRSRAIRCLWMLEEIGQPYELVEKHTNELQNPEYLRLNPNARIPTLVDDGVIIWESMAINLYLAQRYDGSLHCADAKTLGVSA